MDETQDAAPSSTEPQQASTTMVLDPNAPPLDFTAPPPETIVTGGNGSILIASPVVESGNVPAIAEASATAPAIVEEAGAAAVGESIPQDGPTVLLTESQSTLTSTDSNTPSGNSDFVGEAGNVDAGTAPDGAAMPAIAYPSASQPSAEVAPLGESAANQSSQPSADSGASISAGDAGELPAEEPEDSGMPLPSNSIAALAQDGEPVDAGGCAPPVIAGNAVGPVDSAVTATSPEDALTAVVATTAAAFSVDLSERFETRRYPDGTTMRTIGALPEISPVSYPAPSAPAADTPHGLLNAIEDYFTTALRSSRTDGHKLIAQLRAALPQG